MGKFAWAALFVLLTGCIEREDSYVPPRKPLSELAFPERCARLLELSGDLYLNAGQKAAAYEIARNEGCMGPAQPQTVVVR